MAIMCVDEKKDEVSQTDKGELFGYKIVMYDTEKDIIETSFDALVNHLVSYAESYTVNGPTKKHITSIATRKSSNGNGNYSHRNNTLRVFERSVEFDAYSEGMTQILELTKGFDSRIKIQAK